MTINNIFFSQSAYFKQEVDTGEDDDMINYRVMKCPDCEKEVFKEPTVKELQEMTKEAQLRVLKALKVRLLFIYFFDQQSKGFC